MRQSFTKRTAPYPPQNERPTKRIATSSPEEGEVDDFSPPSTHTIIPLPPTPPLLTPERPKDDTLPPHAAISITIPLKRPPAPRDDHSPSPLPLPSAHEPVKAKKDTAVDATPRPPPVEHRWKRPVVQRTRKQELESYGRIFLGCGQQSDYDATAKLGEGTFGYVLALLLNPTPNIAQRGPQSSSTLDRPSGGSQTYPYA